MIVTAEFGAPVFLRQFDLLKAVAREGPNGHRRQQIAQIDAARMCGNTW
jgi:hypothetical protein